MSIKHVRQKHANGCATAALAMLCGLSYDEVASQFQVDFECRGLTIHHVDAWLRENGFAVARMLRYRDFNTEQPVWPPKPWAQLHLCEVRCSHGGMGHWCVMLADGSVLDPLKDEITKLDEYPEVSNVAAVYRVRDLITGEVK